MGALADLYKKKMSSVNNYFPAQQSVRPYGNSPMQTQSSMAMPDMGAAKSRTSQSLGALLPLLGMGLMLGKHEGMDMGRAMGSVANDVSNNLNRQSALEVWKANQINSQQQAQREQAMARIQANRERMDKIFEMDENLYLDPQANAAYQTGDWNGFAQHLADIKWSKPKERDALVAKNVNGVLTWFDKYTGEKVKESGRYGSPKAPKQVNPVTAHERYVFNQAQAGNTDSLSDFDRRIAEKKGWIEAPEEQKPLTGADRSRVLREVRGGYDMGGRAIDGFINDYTDPNRL